MRVAGAHAAEIVAEGEAEFVHRLAGEQLAEEGVEGVARGRGCGGDGEEVHDERIRARRHLKDADGRARAGFPLAVEADDGRVALARGGVLRRVHHSLPHARHALGVADPVHALGGHGREELSALHTEGLARQRGRRRAGRAVRARLGRHHRRARGRRRQGSEWASAGARRHPRWRAAPAGIPGGTRTGRNPRRPHRRRARHHARYAAAAARAVPTRAPREGALSGATAV